MLSFFFCLNFPHIFPTRAKNIAVSHYFFRSKKQAEALERARLLNEQAEQLRKEADKLGKP